MDKIVIPNGNIAVKADYTEQEIFDYQGNPLIEALPLPLSNTEVIERISLYPYYSSDERKLEKHHRIHALDRIFKVFQPLPFHLDLESRISRAIRQGYRHRNWFSNISIKEIQTNQNTISLLNANNTIQLSSSGFAFIGISGLGKTSILQKVFDLYPQVIVHSSYNEVKISAYQLVWLKLECPFDGSLKGLMYEFFSEIDRLLGTNYSDKVMRTRATTDAMVILMSQVVRNCSLGILAIDEIQNLNMAKSGGKERMLNFFVNLVNKIGVPVIFIGTPKATSILQGDFRQARRSTGSSGDMICNRLENDKTWELLVDTIWNYQFINNKVNLDRELLNTLYYVSQGIPDLLKKVYVIAQEYCILEDKDLSPSIIKQVFNERFKLVQPMLKALRTNNLRELARYEDINISSINVTDLLTHTSDTISLDMKAKQVLESNERRKKNIGLKKKESIILKLMESGYKRKEIEECIVDSKLNFNKHDTNKLLTEVVKLVENMKNISDMKASQDTKNSTLESMVDNGLNEGKSAYESLGKYIKNAQDDILFGGE